MSATREQVMAALLNVLSASGPFKTVGRRNRNPESFEASATPALMLVEHSENFRNQSTLQPPIRRLLVRAIIYCDVGDDENAIPSAIVNTLLDGIDPALKGALMPDNVMTNQCTLGGLVQSVVIDGEIIKAPGDVTGKSLAIVPLNILLH